MAQKAFSFVFLVVFPAFTLPSVHKALMKRNEGMDLKMDLPDGTAIKLYLCQSDIQQNALKIS